MIVTKTLDMYALIWDILKHHNSIEEKYISVKYGTFNHGDLELGKPYLFMDTGIAELKHFSEYVSKKGDKASVEHVRSYANKVRITVLIRTEEDKPDDFSLQVVNIQNAFFNEHTRAICESKFAGIRLGDGIQDLSDIEDNQHIRRYDFSFIVDYHLTYEVENDIIEGVVNDILQGEK